MRDWDGHGVPKARLLEKLGMSFAREEAEAIRARADEYRGRFHAGRDAEPESLKAALDANRSTQAG